ncbi:MAG: protein kinase [Alistipes sp.]|nr:protein kinase [Alistipes sp.]
MAFLEEYTLLDELGQGGFATVYKVRHNTLGYVRAIRVLNAIIAKGESDATYQKFLEECRLLLRLGNGNHPHIVHIYQPLLKEQRAIVEMDYVDGQDIIHYLNSQSSFVEIEDVMNLLMNIGSALAYCHHDIYKFCMDREEDNLKDDPQDGSKLLIDDATRKRLLQKYRVIHNDIHSGNIIRREDGTFVLLDFGLAIEGDSVVRSSRRKNGAPEFKAPEKWDNDALLSTQSDIYSFGVVLYEFLAGRVPFPLDKNNSNLVEAEYLLGKAHKETAPEPIFELRKAAFERTHPGETYVKDYPDWLEQLIMKCLEKPLDKRFADGRELFDFVKSHVSMNLLEGSASNSDDSATVKALKNENKILMQQLETTQTQLEECKKRLKEYESKAPSEADSKELEKLRMRVAELEQTVTELEAKNALLLKQLELLQIPAGGGSDDVVAALKAELEATQKALADTRADLEGIKEANTSLEQKIKALQSENEQLKKSSAPVKGGSMLWQILAVVFFLAAGALGYMHFMMGDKPSATTPTEQAASADVSAYEKEIASLEQQLKAKDEQLRMQGGNDGEASTLLAEKQAELEAKTTEIANLQSQVESLEQQLAQKGGDSKALDSKNKEIKDLKSQIKAKENEITTLKSQIDTKDKTIAKLEKEIQALIDRINNL